MVRCEGEFERLIDVRDTSSRPEREEKSLRKSSTVCVFLHSLPTFKSLGNTPFVTWIKYHSYDSTMAMGEVSRLPANRKPSL